AYYLARFYESVDLGHKGTVMLVGRDGVVRARVTFGGACEHPAHQHPSITIGETVMLKLAPDVESQTTHSPSPLDDVERVSTYDVLKDYPLIVGVGLADADLFADYNASRWRLISAATLVSLLVIGFTALLARQML